VNDNAIIYIGNLFTDRLRGKINDGKLCRELGLALSALNFQTGKKKFTVEITKNNSASEFFGMRVFPTIEVGDKFMQSITSGEIERYTDIVNRWKSLNDWVIELDSTLFDRNVINFTTDELTAMLIGSIVPIRKFN